MTEILQRCYTYTPYMYIRVRNMLRRIKSFSTSREQREVLLLVLGGSFVGGQLFCKRALEAGPGLDRGDPVRDSHFERSGRRACDPL